ncbi:hypothetical protein FF80_02890 [Devosia sp. LC5]|uniref:hypothetical protein n=1 Tax=Devosia sp. LC5 TaxID=1502724 RepID=UPI0004E46F42|nr:hypothetical protein [Devosia sp. LC5]KFC65040.1 hypothetical protein FF80_02890 [Devosia sp. LC5]
MDGLNTAHEVDWAAVQRDHEHNNGTQKEICARHGITIAQLRFRRERQGWRLRSTRDVDLRLLINRMLRVLEKQVRNLEKTMTEPVDKSAALLGTMAKTLEKLMELETANRGRQPAQKKEMSDLRNKLAQRIEQLKHR